MGAEVLFRLAVRVAPIAVVASLIVGTASSAAADAELDRQSSGVPVVRATAAAPAADQTLPGIREHSHERPHGHRRLDAEPGHVDPAPAGVDVRRYLPTRDLLRGWETRRARKLEQLRVAAPGDATTSAAEERSPGGAPDAPAAADPQVAGSTVPPGVSGLPGLGAHVATSCAGTGSDGMRVEVLYVVESDDVDRYDAVLPLLRNEVANVDDTFALSAAVTGGMRRVRWVFTSPTTCEPVITKVVVPPGSLAGFGSSVTALRNAGYTNPHRKYLVFADATVLCGVGHIYRDDRPELNANDGNASAMFARVDTACWETTASHGSTAAHEIMHTIGGVQLSAPNSTPYGHCTDRYDLMCYNDGSGATMRNVCSSSHGALFDCRGDDYFSTAPAAESYLATYWNSANSSFLDHSGVVAPVEPVAPADPVPAPTSPSPTDIPTPTTPVTPPAPTAPVPPPTPTTPVTPPTPDPPVSAPTVTISGPTSVLPGLPARLVATASATGSYTWEVSPAACLPGSTSGPALTIQCSADHRGAVEASVRFVRSDGTAATATHRVSPSGAAKLTQSVTASAASVRSGRAMTLTVKLRRGTTPVRGRVQLSASSNRQTWRTIAGSVDTGADGVAVFVVRPKRTTYLRLHTPVASESGWSINRNPIVRVAVARVATTLTISTAAEPRAVVSGHLVNATTARALPRRAVQLQYRTPGTTTWRTLRTVMTRASGRISATVGGARGTSYRWRYGGSATHLAETSASTYIR